jgi:hypothetical protein
MELTTVEMIGMALAIIPPLLLVWRQHELTRSLSASGREAKGW